MKRLAGLILVIISLLFTSTFAHELKLYRINDLVGDTIDAFERLQYNLFPNITNFESAIILTNNDTIYVAEINCRQADSVTKLFFRLTPREVEKISYCIENADTIRNQVARDEFARLALEKFWNDIELKPIINLSDLSIIKPKPSTEDRVAGVIYGTTIGSALGGYIGSQMAIKQIRPGGAEIVTCFPEYPCIAPIPYPPTYQVNHSLFWPIAISGTVGGIIAGYTIGEQSDRKNVSAANPEPIKKSQGACVALSIIPALALGGVTIVELAAAHFGTTEPFWYTMENDPKDLTTIFAVITGIGVTASIIHISHVIGRSIDRDRAAKKNIKPTNN